MLGEGQKGPEPPQARCDPPETPLQTPSAQVTLEGVSCGTS